MKYTFVIIMVVCILAILYIYWYQPPISISKSTYYIPKIIHKVFIQHSMQLPRNVSEPIKNAHLSWEQQNPEYEIKYYSGTDCELYLQKYFSDRHYKAYKKLKPYAYKVDFFRYCLMYHEGGVYTDWKMVCLYPLHNLRNKKWVSSWDVGENNMLNGFFMTYSKNPILHTAIEMCLHNIENNLYGNWCLDVTGPKLLGQAFSQHYPQIEFGKPYNKDGILLGTFSPPNIFINNKLFLKSKCEHCNHTQEWEHGNNYIKMWLNKDIYHQQQ